jgi:hypothetical protein
MNDVGMEYRRRVGQEQGAIQLEESSEAFGQRSLVQPPEEEKGRRRLQFRSYELIVRSGWPEGRILNLGGESRASFISSKLSRNKEVAWCE